MKHRNTLPLATLAAITALLSSCSTTTPNLDAKTDAVLQAMSAKIASANSLQVSVTREASPGFNAGITVAQRASGIIQVQRPDKLAANLKSSEGARSIGFDGSTITVVDHGAGTHAVVKAPGDIDKAVLGIQNLYGISPPVAELLANNPRSVLLTGVTSGKHMGTEKVNGVECDRLSFQQDRLSWTLWVATGDKLPRRITQSYPNGEGGAPLIMTATITQWELNVPVSTGDLAVKVPAGSRKIEMIPLGN